MDRRLELRSQIVLGEIIHNFNPKSSIVNTVITNESVLPVSLWSSRRHGTLWLPTS